MPCAPPAPRSSSDDGILPTAFARTASRVATYAYMRDGTDQFLATFGPAAYHSAAEYLKAVGTPLFRSSIGVEDDFRNIGGVRIEQRRLDADPDAERLYHAPRRAMLAAYLEPLDRLRLDGYVYPAIQMPPPDETMPQDGGLSGGPHSNTSWVNMIGVPAMVVPAGTYASGLPFGLEFSARPWTDGDLLAIACGVGAGDAPPHRAAARRARLAGRDARARSADWCRPGR